MAPNSNIGKSRFEELVKRKGKNSTFFFNNSMSDINKKNKRTILIFFIVIWDMQGLSRLITSKF